MIKKPALHPAYYDGMSQIEAGNAHKTSVNNFKAEIKAVTEDKDCKTRKVMLEFPDSVELTNNVFCPGCTDGDIQICFTGLQLTSEIAGKTVGSMQPMVYFQIGNAHACNIATNEVDHSQANLADIFNGMKV